MTYRSGKAGRLKRLSLAYTVTFTSRLLGSGWILSYCTKAPSMSWKLSTRLTLTLLVRSWFIPILCARLYRLDIRSGL